MSTNPPNGWTDWTVTRLRDELKHLGRPVYGTKSTLQTRYLDAIADPYQSRPQPLSRSSKAPHVRYSTSHPTDPSMPSSAGPGPGPGHGPGPGPGPSEQLLTHPSSSPTGPAPISTSFAETPVTSRRGAASSTGATRKIRRHTQSPEMSIDSTILRTLMEAQREAAYASKRVDDIRALEILLRLEQSLVGDDQTTIDRSKRVHEMIDEILNP